MMFAYNNVRYSNLLSLGKEDCTKECTSISISELPFPIADLGLDIQDDLGRHEVGFVENTIKNPIGEKGCLFEANFLINKVPGQ